MHEQVEEPLVDRTAVELFAGGGGLAMAVHRAGFRPLLFNEFAPRACETLLANRAALAPTQGDPPIPTPGDRPPLVSGDIQGVDFSYLARAKEEAGLEVDVLAGGPPCQPFSLGGVAKGDEDKRNMFPQMIRAMREIQPKAVICENVRGLLRKSFDPYFQYILDGMRLPTVVRGEEDWRHHARELARRIADGSVAPHERYDVEWIKVNAADYGVPQIRHRVIIVAFRADLKVDMKQFVASVEATEYSEDALIRSLLPDGDQDGEYWRRHERIRERAIPDHVKERVISGLRAPLALPDGKKPWRTLRDALAGECADGNVLPDIPDHQLDTVERNLGGYTDHIGWPGARIYPGHTPNELDRPAKTVKAGVHGVPGGESVLLLDERVRDEEAPGGLRYKHRYMTVRETARVMTFPDDWQLVGPRGEKMRQLGNAVPVLLGEVFAKAVLAALEKASKQEGR
ncbi:DNA cytosine methyltransferase [Streptomyces sp. NPDC050535]|uniref:DNA cytosine methyltransferase n=1 Tax=Streptomyces sp. NPDC050535 TaxID=3365626 RepID=UPI00379134A7